MNKYINEVYKWININEQMNKTLGTDGEFNVLQFQQPLVLQTGHSKLERARYLHTAPASNQMQT